MKKSLVTNFLFLLILVFCFTQGYICTPQQPAIHPTVKKTVTGNYDTIPSGTKANLHAIHYLNRTDGVIAGDNGTVLFTTDGGMTWKPKNSPNIAFNFYGAFITDGGKNTIVVGDNYSIYQSIDLGNSWKQVFAGAPGFSLRSVYFANNNLGYAVGDSGMILFTKDGGNTWNKQNLKTNTKNRLNSVYFSVVPSPDAYKVMIVGDKGTYIYNQSKDPTDLVIKNEPNFVSVNLFCVTSPAQDSTKSVVFVSGSGGKIFKSTSGGAIWDSSNTVIVAGSANLYGIHFTSPGLGFAVGQKGTVARFSNGSWTLLDQLTSSNLNAVDPFFGGSSGITTYPTATAVGDAGGIYFINAVPTTDWYAELSFDNTKCQWTITLWKKGKFIGNGNYTQFQVWANSNINCRYPDVNNPPPGGTGPVGGWICNDNATNYLYTLTLPQEGFSEKANCYLTAVNFPGFTGNFQLFMIDRDGRQWFINSFVIQYP